MQFTPQQERTLLDIARASIRQALGEVAVPPVADDAALQQPAGCFVTLHDRHSHRLRGCVGRLDAKRPLDRTLGEVAASVLDDPRFSRDRVKAAELDRLQIDISVLSPLVPARDPLAFDPLQEGIYLTIGGRAGCFLPQVARETGWSKEQLLARLCTEKLGAPANAWQSPEARLETFHVAIIGPVPF